MIAVMYLQYATKESHSSPAGAVPVEFQTGSQATRILGSPHRQLGRVDPDSRDQTDPCTGNKVFLKPLHSSSADRRLRDPMNTAPTGSLELSGHTGRERYGCAEADARKCIS